MKLVIITAALLTTIGAASDIGLDPMPTPHMAYSAAARHLETPNPAPLAASAGPTALLSEITSELATMRRTRYQHATEVHRSRGEFFYDCSGFVDYALTHSRPLAARALPITASAGRPLAQDFQRYLHGLDQGKASDTWASVPTIDAVRPGDVIAWLKTPDSKSRDTGHVMIVLESAVPGRDAHEWLFKIADSTANPHADDSRGGSDGLGTGTIGLQVDDRGRPIGFFWRGGLSPQPKLTEVALGRLI